MNHSNHGISGLNDTGSHYDSALENLSAFTSFNESFNNNSSNSTTGSTDFDNTLSNDPSSTTPLLHSDTNSMKNASLHFIQTESSDNMEVDPKSQLANKTIFKTDNPNLSIIEISNSSIKDDENSVYLIDSSEEDEGTSSRSGETDAERRRRKGESLLHSSRQKLDVPDSTAADINIDEDAELLNRKAEEDKHELSPKATPRTLKVYDTLEEFEKNLPETVTVLPTPFGSKVYLVGTAHFSEESQDDVSYVIRNVRPDVVMVELCPSRIHILKLDERTLLEEAKNINLAKIRSILKTNGYINGIFFIMFLHMSAQLAKELGVAPGGEFRRAFEEIQRLPGCMLQLGDRPINITLQRALRALSFWQTLKLVWRLTSTENISIEEVEECKKRDLLEKLMQEMAGEFPAFSDVFVKERDMYLCHSLQVAALPQQKSNGAIQPMRVVGVVGIGHAKGIAKHWGNVDSAQIPDILEIPPASWGTRICKYTIKYGFISLTLYGAFRFFRPKLTKLL